MIKLTTISSTEQHEPEGLVTPRGHGRIDHSAVYDATAAPVPSLSPSGAIHITLDVFEGPLDMLLSLIERHGLAVTEISVVAVAGQFLQQIQAWQEINMTVTAEFLAMAARLLLLKSRALLPRPPQIMEPDDQSTDDGNARDLVDRLTIYKAFVDVAAQLRCWQEEGRASYARPEQGSLPDYLLAPPLDSAAEQQALVQAAARCMRRARRRADATPRTIPPSELDLDFHTVLIAVQRSIAGGPHGGQPFDALLPSNASVLLIVATFLALLELVRQGAVILLQERPFGDLRIQRAASMTTA